MRPRQSKPTARPRRPPDLPDMLSPVADAVALFRGREIVVSNAVVGESEIGAISAAKLRIESAVLERVALSGSTFVTIHLRDVRLTGCDLGNVETRALTALRVEFLNCRMTGFRVTEECTVEDALVSEGNQRYAQFASARFRCSEFVACNFSDAFLAGADLRGCVFRGCTLRNVDLTGAKLEGADLRGSEIADLRLAPRDVYGLIVEPAQAMVLSALLGIRIR